jgi:hypothetical protein
MDRRSSPFLRRVRRSAVCLVALVLTGVALSPGSFASRDESDRDGDGVPDAADRCPDTPRGLPIVRDGCTELDTIRGA